MNEAGFFAYVDVKGPGGIPCEDDFAEADSDFGMRCASIMR